MIAFVAFILLAFSAAYLTITSKTLYAMNAEANEDAREIADRVASEINTAIAEGSGYSKTFRLPDKVQGAAYTITVEKGMVFVDWSGNSVASRTVANSTTGGFAAGWNEVKNKGGVVFAN